MPAEFLAALKRSTRAHKGKAASVVSWKKEFGRNISCHSLDLAATPSVRLGWIFPSCTEVFHGHVSSLITKMQTTEVKSLCRGLEGVDDSGFSSGAHYMSAHYPWFKGVKMSPVAVH